MSTNLGSWNYHKIENPTLKDIMLTGIVALIVICLILYLIVMYIDIILIIALIVCIIAFVYCLGKIVTERWC